MDTINVTVTQFELFTKCSAERNVARASPAHLAQGPAPFGKHFVPRPFGPALRGSQTWPKANEVVALPCAEGAGDFVGLCPSSGRALRALRTSFRFAQSVKFKRYFEYK